MLLISSWYFIIQYIHIANQLMYLSKLQQCFIWIFTLVAMAENSNVVTQLKPIITWGSKLQVLLKYNEKFKEFMQNKVHSYIAIILLLSIYGFCVVKRVGEFISAGRFLGAFLMNLGVTILLFTHCYIISGISSVNSKNLTILFKIFDDIDGLLMRYTTIPQLWHVSCIFNIFNAITIVLIILDNFNQIFLRRHSTHIYYTETVLHVYVALYRTVFEVLILTNITKRVKMFNEILHSSNLNDTLRIHSSLCKLTQQFNDTFGISMFLTFLNIIANFLATFHMVLIKESFSGNIIFAVLTIIFWMIILMVSNL